MSKIKQLQLPLDFIDRKHPNYTKAELTFTKGKHWKPCKTELSIMKKKLDKLTPAYTDAQNFGLDVTAKRIFKKAVQISKRITVLLGGRDD